MVSIKRKVLFKGDITQEQLMRVLQRHEDLLTNAVDNDTIYDDSDIKAKMGYDNIPSDTNLQAEIEAKADSSALNNKANANHSHTLNKITDVETVEAVVTYSDDSTETLLLVVQTPSEP